MEKIVNELHEVAAKGSTQSLHNLLEKDPFLLDRYMIICYGETPLHIAAMLGHLDFCIALLRRKPELAEELDSRRCSALHLASAKGFTEIVKVLISVCPKMGFAFDEDGKIPVHIAAMKGKAEVLKELISVQPDAAHKRAEMCQGETVLHLCVQYSQLESLRVLVEHLNDKELVNAKDNNGNSILHLAVFDKQVQIINYLVQNTKIDVFAVNSSGLTALDILSQMRRDSKYIDIFHCLHNYKSQSSNSNPSPPLREPKYPSRRYRRLSKLKYNKAVIRSGTLLNKQTKWVEKQQNSLMVVASLLATMGFQAALTPPCGVWQDDTRDLYDAGNSIFADSYPDLYLRFMICNTVGFVSSLSVILLLVSGLPYTRQVFMWILMVVMWISISAMAYTYAMSILATISPNNYTIDVFINILPLAIAGWCVLMAMLNLMHTIRLISHLMRRWSSKQRVVMCISMTLLWGLITSTLSTLIIVHFKSIDDFSQVYWCIMIVAIIGWLALLAVLGVVALVGGVLIIVKKLVSCLRRLIKEAMKSSRNQQDSVIVVSLIT